MTAESYFRFDNDNNKIKCKCYHNHPKRNGSADNTQCHALHKYNAENRPHLRRTRDRMWLKGVQLYSAFTDHRVSHEFISCVGIWRQVDSLMQRRRNSVVLLRQWNYISSVFGHRSVLCGFPYAQQQTIRWNTLSLSLACLYPPDTWRNNNVIITSKRRFDVVLT